MKPPKLTRSLVLEEAVRLPDGAGGYTENWTQLGTLWAELQMRNGRETSGEGGAMSLTGYRVVIRSAAFGAPSRPVAGQRFRDGTRIFKIHAVGEFGGDGRYLTCFVQEEVAA